MHDAVVIKLQPNDKEHIMVVLRIASLCGICPWRKPTRLSSFYQIFVTCFTFGISVISIYKNFNRLSSSTTTSGMTTFITLLSSIFSMIQGTSIQIIALLYQNSWKKLIEELYVENNLPLSMNINFKILIVHLLIISKHVWSWVIWQGLRKWEYSICYIFKFINEYYAVTLVTLLIHINHALESRLLILKQMLFKVPEMPPKEITFQLKRIEVTYMRLMQSLNYFNCVFGYSILFIMGNTIGMVLENVHYGLDFHHIGSVQEILFVVWIAASAVVALVEIIIVIITVIHINVVGF